MNPRSELLAGAALGEKSEPVALVDMDGTIANFSKGLGDAMKTLETPEENGKWDYEDYDQDTEPDFMKARRRLVKHVPGFWRNLPRIERGFKILDILTELDFDIIIFTKAPTHQPSAFMEKAEWCEENLVGYKYKLSMVQDKGLHYGKLLVDDWPKYVSRWLQFRPRGHVIMPSCKYNRDFNHDQVIRYEGNSAAEIQMIAARIAQIRRECRP